MSDSTQQQLGNTLWTIADKLRGAMNADDFRDYMLAFLFLRYLSDNYEIATRKVLGNDYPELESDSYLVPLSIWYELNADDIEAFEKQMRRKIHYVIKPQYLWTTIAHLARTQSDDLLNTLQTGFNYIETESFESTFQGLFSEINLASDKLGRTYADRNAKLCAIIQKIADGLAEFSTDIDALGDAYEYLISQFAAGSGKKAGEFYTPQQISDILSGIVTLDSQEPSSGTRKRLESVMDFACGSGSLLLNVRKKVNTAGGTIGKIYGQEKIITTYQNRSEEPRYSRRVTMEEIKKNGFNLNISRYISTATAEEEIDLRMVNSELTSLEQSISDAHEKHNAFLKELGLPLLP
jgi:type I restriction enzyme M protein